MAFQRLAALIQGDGILQIDFALLQARDDGFQLLQGGLKAHVANGHAVALRFCRCGNDRSPKFGASQRPRQNATVTISQVWRRAPPANSVRNYMS